MFRALSALLLLAVGATASVAQSAAHATLLSGRVRAVDGGSVEGVSVRALCGGASDSAMVDAGGRFSIALDCRGGAPEIELVDAADRYHRARPRTPAEWWSGEHILLLIPRVWTIASGSHAGAAVAIDLRGATTPACPRGCSAFYTTEDTVHSRPPGIPVWLEHSLPLRVAFSEDDGVEISEADSVAFMQAAEALEADLGRRWFQPGRFTDLFTVGPEDRFGSLVVSIDPLLRDAGRGNWAAQGGEIVAGVVYFQNARLIRDPFYSGIVAHELMHALGYGHTCSWRSVLANQLCEGRRADAPTPEDVAHAQLLIRLRTLERHHGIHGTIRAALTAMR